jgi:hypothetical protein
MSAANITVVYLVDWAKTMVGSAEDLCWNDGIVASKLLCYIFPCLHQSMARQIAVGSKSAQSSRLNWEVVYTFVRRLEIPSAACDTSGIRAGQRSCIAAYCAVRAPIAGKFTKSFG